MKNPLRLSRFTGALASYLLGLLAIGIAPAARAEWWDAKWPIRKAIVLDASPSGVALDAPTGPLPVLIRLHGANHQFAASAPDGRDLRFLAEDGKTLLPAHVESFDPLLNEGFAWVLAPELKPGARVGLSLYYGKADAGPAPGQALYDPETLLVYHFSGTGAPQDASGKGRHAANAAVSAPGSMIGNGLRLTGGEPVRVSADDTLKRAAAQPLTVALWAKTAALADRSVLLHWGDANTYLQFGLAAGVPYAEIRDRAASRRTPAAAPLAAGAWKHLALAASSEALVVYVDGVEYSRLPAALPALQTDILLGADSAGKNAFSGEIDELSLSSAARPASWIKFLAVSQSGANDSLKLVNIGNDESGASSGGGHGGFIAETLGHLALFGDIAKNMMFDGWIAVGCCIIMMVIGWIVALQKFAYLKRVEQGTEEFLRQWKEVSSDLTAIDHADSENVKTLGGKADAARIRLMQQSPLYHIYHIGSEEIRHRLQDKRGFNGLSARSITAIKASLDAGLTREVHNLKSGLVSLTIGIAGGPYVGLMGTVVGVMITFAVIAKTGEVEVNSIAPGIASALLATVFGLLVAIPALFLYSFLNSRIKDAVSNMQLFIDEFITKMAEYYPTPADGGHQFVAKNGSAKK